MTDLLSQGVKPRSNPDQTANVTHTAHVTTTVGRLLSSQTRRRLPLRLVSSSMLSEGESSPCSLLSGSFFVDSDSHKPPLPLHYSPS